MSEEEDLAGNQLCPKQEIREIESFGFNGYNATK
jgi:hypothetical protein